MKLKIRKFAGAVGIVSALAAIPAVANAQTNSQPSDVDTHYGLLNLLDHRSVYGQGIFPEPFLVDDSDLEVNEARLDWVHTKGHDVTGDELTAELEKGFGPATFEAELHYERDVEGGQVTDGIGNIDLGARIPFYQYVASSGFIDATLGGAVEVGIPVHSAVSKNTEFVPKVFGDLLIGKHVTIQAITGYSMLFGPGEDGGAHSWEYGVDLGYSFTHDQLAIPHIQQVVPMFEMSGETALNHGESGQTSLIGLAGIRVMTDAIGRVQPRLGIGFMFPMNSNARDEMHWGIATSLVFEY